MIGAPMRTARRSAEFVGIRSYRRDNENTEQAVVDFFAFLRVSVVNE